MPIIEIESAWRETGIICPFCEGEWMTYSNGETRPQCGNDNCLRVMPDEYIYKRKPLGRYLRKAHRIDNAVWLIKKEVRRKEES